MDKARDIIIYITCILAFLIIIISVGFGIYLLNLPLPKEPILTIGKVEKEQPIKGQEISNYNELISSIQLQKPSVFYLLVTRTLIPIFSSLITAVLTYIFAQASFAIFKSYIDRRYLNLIMLRRSLRSSTSIQLIEA
jgi:hypothetical protein